MANIYNLSLKGLGLDQLTLEEVNQLQNIDDSTISTAQWGYLSGISNSSIRGLISATGPVSYDSSTGVIDSQILDNTISTGVISGGLLTINADTTKFDISDGSGVIASAGNHNTVSWSGLTAKSFKDINGTPGSYSGILTYVFIKSTGDYFCQSSVPTNDQVRDNIFLGVLVHTNFTNIDVTNDQQAVIAYPTNQVRDLLYAIGFLNTSGNTVTSAGASLRFSKGAGTMLAYGANFKNDPKNPHIVSLPAVNTASSGIFQYRMFNGTSSALTLQDINPDILDNYGNYPGTSVSVNKWTIQRVYTFTSGVVKITPGQFEYQTCPIAINSIATEEYKQEPSLSNGILVGFIIVKQGATDLTDMDQACFVQATKFGSASGSGQASASIVPYAPLTYDETTDDLKITQDTAFGVPILDSNGYIKLAQTDFPTYIQGTANRVTVSGSAGGAITLSGPQNIDAQASPLFKGLTIGFFAPTFSALSTDGLVKTNSSGVLGNVTLGSGLNYTTGTLSNSGVLSITGTADQINASASTGAITLSLPQDIDLGASFEVGDLTVGNITITNPSYAESKISNSTHGIQINGQSAYIDVGKVSANVISMVADSVNLQKYVTIGTTLTTDKTISFAGTATTTDGIEFADPGGTMGAIRYDHSQNDLSFMTNGVADRMVIDSDGKIGMGINPSEELHLYKSHNGVTALLIDNPDTTTANYSTQTYLALKCAGTVVGGLKTTAKNLGGLSSQALYLTTEANLPIAFGLNNSATPSMLLDTSGNLGIGTTPSAKLHVYETLNQNSSYIHNNHASFSNIICQIEAQRAASGSAWTFLSTRSDVGIGGDYEHLLRGDGSSDADGSWRSTGADYAEYFESVDGKAIEKGTSVVLDGEKVRPYDDTKDQPDDIMGVSRPKEWGQSSASIGNSAGLRWSRKYITDEWGTYELEDYKVYEWKETTVTINEETKEEKTKEETKQWADYNELPDGETLESIQAKATFVVQQKKKLNPDYDPEQEYIPREKRDEWILVGLLGQVPVKSNQVVNPRWRKMKEITNTVWMYLIR